MKAKNYILIILIFTLTIPSIGQNVNKSMVKDTSALNEQSESLGYKLISVLPSPCNESLSEKPVKNRISGKYFKNDTLTIKTTFIANCCTYFLGEIQIINDTSLNLIFTNYGGECFCFCCFELTYKVITKDNKVNTYQLNGRPVIETNQVFKIETTEIEKYESGVTKTKTFMQDNEVVRVNHYDMTGELRQIDYYVEGKLYKEQKTK